MRARLLREFDHHRTRINEIYIGNDQLWTASSDETVQIVPLNPASKAKPVRIPHRVAVRSILPLELSDLAEPFLITGSGDVLKVFDLTTVGEPEFVGEIDAHWHDIIAIRLWKKLTTASDNTTRVEPWILSISLDGTIRKWKLIEMLTSPSPSQPDVVPMEINKSKGFHLSEEEERELAELVDEE